MGMEGPPRTRTEFQGISQYLERGHLEYILRVTLSFPRTDRQTAGLADVCDYTSLAGFIHDSQGRILWRVMAVSALAERRGRQAYRHACL